MFSRLFAARSAPPLLHELRISALSVDNSPDQESWGQNPRYFQTLGSLFTFCFDPAPGSSILVLCISLSKSFPPLFSYEVGTCGRKRPISSRPRSNSWAPSGRLILMMLLPGVGNTIEVRFSALSSDYTRLAKLTRSTEQFPSPGPRPAFFLTG